MKKISLILLFFVASAILPSATRAQSHEDVVYLKNGSVIRGIVVEQVPGESLKIETRDGNLLVFRMNEVSRMTRETAGRTPTYRRATNAVPAPTAERSKFNKPRGYLGLVEVGTGAWAASEDTSNSVTMVNGYRFFPQLAVGVGAGFEVWGSGDVTIPLFLHLRSDFIRNRVSPFVAVNFGGYVPLDSYHDGGLFELQGGVSFNVGRKYRMAVGLSFVASRYPSGYYLDSYSSHGLYDYRETFGDAGLKLKVGFSF